MELALAIANLLNAATPGIAQLIILIKQTDGKLGVVAMLDEADQNFNANLQQAKDWLKSHGS